jgi:hypothetical protein
MNFTPQIVTILSEIWVGTGSGSTTLDTSTYLSICVSYEHIDPKVPYLSIFSQFNENFKEKKTKERYRPKDADS